MLNYDLYRFLSSVSFEDVELKVIYKGFLKANHKYQNNKKLYSNFYKLIQSLDKDNLINSHKEERNRLYTSNYTYEEITKKFPKNSDDLYISIKQDEGELINEINQLEEKINTYMQYADTHPILENLVNTKLVVMQKDKDKLVIKLVVVQELLAELVT